MSGLTKADYKRRSEDLTQQLARMTEAKNDVDATLVKYESDLAELQADYAIAQTELKALRKQLKMVGDWIEDALT